MNTDAFDPVFDEHLAADRDSLAEVVRQFLQHETLIVVSSNAGVASWILDFCRQHKLKSPFLILTDSNGEAPAHVETASLELTAISVDDWLLKLGQRLADPPASLMKRLDSFDPQRSAIIVTPPLTEYRDTLFGRRAYGWRRPEWTKYEDKLVSDSLWARAGVRAPRSMITNPTPQGLTTAFTTCDEGSGVVASADAAYGLHSGSRGVIWIRDRAEILQAATALSSRCKTVRIAPFIEGISCTVHGLATEAGTTVFRPIEQVILRETKGLFPLLGGNALWTPRPTVSSEVRQVARQVGDHLRRDAKYRGFFGIDGILSSEGFMPLEVNARMGGFIANGGPVPGLPLDIVHAMAMEGDANAIDIAALERVMVHAIGEVSGTRLSYHLGHPSGVDFRTETFQWSGNAYTPCSAGAQHDLILSLKAGRPSGTAIMMEFPRNSLYIGRPLGPFALSAVEAGLAMAGIPPRALSYAEVVD